jgi:hypothetical protein
VQKAGLKRAHVRDDRAEDAPRRELPVDEFPEPPGVAHVLEDAEERD